MVQNHQTYWKITVYKPANCVANTHMKIPVCKSNRIQCNILYITNLEKDIDIKVKPGKVK